MSTYLDLVNKVIQESSSEQDELTSVTWATATAGRRLYPRIKRNVADAWKGIQTSRDQWSFMTARYSDLVYPRVIIKEGTRAAGTPTAGATFNTPNARFELVVRNVVTTGDWTAGTAEGYIEFDDYDGSVIVPGDVFTESYPVASDGTFTYITRGSYNFAEEVANLRAIQWETFTTSALENYSTPAFFIPWDNWMYNDGQGTQSFTTAPAFVSQDYQGNVAFYPPTLEPFRVTFIYKTSPQILSAYTDEPTAIPAEYHDWIAWEALKKFAIYDKNSTLYTYANNESIPYKLRAEKNFMPLVAYQMSRFNNG